MERIPSCPHCVAKGIAACPWHGENSSANREGVSMVGTALIVVLITVVSWLAFGFLVLM